MSKTTTPYTSNLPIDASRNPIQLGNSFVTQDATGTPKNSPLAYSNSVIALTVPDRAVKMVVKPSTALRISEASDASRYDIVAANAIESVECAGMQTIYIVRDSADGNLSFRFVIV